MAEDWIAAAELGRDQVGRGVATLREARRQLRLAAVDVPEPEDPDDANFGALFEALVGDIDDGLLKIVEASTGIGHLMEQYVVASEVDPATPPVDQDEPPAFPGEEGEQDD